MNDYPQDSTKNNYFAYQIYFERILNSEKFKERLVTNYFTNFEYYQSLLSEIHRNFIHALIIKQLSETHNWNELLLQNIFPITLEIENEIKKITTDSDKQFDYLTLESFHQEFLNSQFVVQDNKLSFSQLITQSKFNGAFYTSNEIVSLMCQESFHLLATDMKSKNFKALDFAAGTGNFYFEMLKNTASFLNKSPIDCAIENLFAFDKDITALSILKMKACYILNIHNIKDLQSIERNIFNLDFIDYGINRVTDNQDLFSLNSSNEYGIPSHFDIILSNPPYLNLKYNRPSKSVLPDSVHSYYSSLIKNIVKKVRDSDAFMNSSSGMLNLYRLSIDLMLTKLSLDGVMTIICPSSLFADKTALKIRKELISNFDLSSITYFREDANLFEGVTQSTVIFTVKNSKPSSRIKIINNGNSFSIPKKIVRNCFPESLEIPLVDEISWGIIAKLNNFSNLKSLPFIRNKRGELDLTLHKNYITPEDTSYQLIRGNRLKKDGIDRKHKEFVDITAFKKVKSAEYFSHDFETKRLVCKQISNIDSKIRLKFFITEPRDIIANSCNYLSFTQNEIPVDFYLNQLNSPLLNWFFKTISSNNHVNNYELDSLPILDHNQISKKSVDEIKKGNLKHLYEAFSLSDVELNYLGLV